MNFDELEQVCFDIWMKAQEGNPCPTVTVLGPPGTGKTTCGRSLADRMTQVVRKQNPKAEPAQCKVLDLSSMLPEDLMGLPFRDGDVTRYCPQSWLEPLCRRGAYGVLVLDDLPAAQAQVQVAARQLSLERRVHEMQLARGVFIMVTGNRREDKSAATVLPAHFRNSTVILPFKPSFKGWEKWFLGNSLDSDITAFLRYKPAHFSRLPKDADKAGAFATPRTWAMLGSLTSAVQEDSVRPVAEGLVGEGVAVEFAAFRMLRRELVSPEQVIENPRRAVPNPARDLASPDKMVALVTGLAEVSAKRSKARSGAKPFLLGYLVALAHVTKHSREFVAVSVATFNASGGDMNMLLDVAAENRDSNPDVGNLLDHLARSLEMT